MLLKLFLSSITKTINFSLKSTEDISFDNQSPHTSKINYRHAALINDNIRGKFTLFCLVFTSIQITDNIFPLNKFSVAFN